LRENWQCEQARSQSPNHAFMDFFHQYLDLQGFQREACSPSLTKSAIERNLTYLGQRIGLGWKISKPTCSSTPPVKKG
jgi:hypothetical protein